MRVSEILHFSSQTNLDEEWPQACYGIAQLSCPLNLEVRILGPAAHDVSCEVDKNIPASRRDLSDAGGDQIRTLGEESLKFVRVVLVRQPVLPRSLARNTIDVVVEIYELQRS